jgi:hypothetical protein
VESDSVKLKDITAKLDLECLTPELSYKESEPISNVHAAESLSELLSHAEDGGILLTTESNLRMLAVAVLKRIPAMVFTSAKRPEPMVVREAVEAGIPLYASKETLFTLAGRLYILGLRESL